MAIIPNNEQFIGLSPTVNTTERRSALINAESQAYTMQDITDTVSATIPAPVNPTSGRYPINKNGVFVDSGLSNTVAVLPPFIPPTVGSLGLKYYDDFAGLTLLELNPLDLAYTFGEAGYNAGVDVFAGGGISIYPALGEMVIGCGISSPTNGVFRASGAMGYVTIGTNPTTSIGVQVAGGAAVKVGSSFIGLLGPTDTVTPVRWTKVKDENGNTYWYAMYQ